MLVVSKYFAKHFTYIFFFNSYNNHLSSYFYSLSSKETGALAALKMVICYSLAAGKRCSTAQPKADCSPGDRGNRTVSLSGQKQHWIQLLAPLNYTSPYLLTFQGGLEPSKSSSGYKYDKLSSWWLQP